MPVITIIILIISITLMALALRLLLVACRPSPELPLGFGAGCFREVVALVVLVVPHLQEEELLVNLLPMLQAQGQAQAQALSADPTVAVASAEEGGRSLHPAPPVLLPLPHT